jgi:hypothetical protein
MEWRNCYCCSQPHFGEGAPICKCTLRECVRCGKCTTHCTCYTTTRSGWFNEVGAEETK